MHLCSPLDDEGSDPLNIETCSSKSISDSDSSEDDEDDPEPEDQQTSNGIAPMTPPNTTAKKRKRKDTGERFSCIIPCSLMYMFVEPILAVKKITYMLTIASAAELKKAAAKRKLKAQNFRLDSDEPWDTFKAQILVKISMAIKPKCLTFGNYTLLFSITRLVPKPGMPVESEADYLFMIEQAIKTKTPMVNIMIDENAKEAELDKENEESNQEEGNKKGKKKVSTIATRSYKLLLIHNRHRPARNHQFMQRKHSAPA